jgi:hypothetical protein
VQQLKSRLGPDILLWIWQDSGNRSIKGTARLQIVYTLRVKPDRLHPNLSCTKKSFPELTADM